MILCIALRALFKDSHSLTSFITEKNRLRVETGMSITTCFFCAMTDTSGKVKRMSQSFVVGSIGNGLVDIFPQGETHTDRLD